jgi:hypothetical protein
MHSLPLSIPPQLVLARFAVTRGPEDPMLTK